MIEEYEHTDADAPNAAPDNVTGLFVRGDHVELAARMLAELRVRGETVSAEGSMFVYGGRIFEAVKPEELSRIVQGYAGAKKRTDKGTAPLKLKRQDVTGSVALAHDQAAQPNFFVDAPPGVAFSDCFVRLEGTLEKVPHSPKNRARYAYPFGYSNRQPARFLAFLNECFAGCQDAEERVAAVQQYAGVSLLGIASRFQRALVLKGDGANGKSVCSTVLERAMPPGACVSIPPQQFGDEYRLAMLAGKRLNIVSELPETEILDSEAFKAIVAGDATTGRHIRQAPFTFRPVAGHVFSANRLPGTADQSYGFWRRFIVLEFPNVVPEAKQDPALADKLTRELPAIVGWFLRGAADAAAAGRIQAPTSSAKALSEWQHIADQVRAFIAECTSPADSGNAYNGTKASTLYAAYRRWAGNSGHKALSSTTFGLRLGQIGVSKSSTRFGNFYALELSGESV